MPFDESPKDPKNLPNRLGLKNINGQKSMFDNQPKQPTQEDFQNKVQAAQDKMSGYKKRAAELFLAFSNTVADKTLPQNKNMFNVEAEKELLQNMIQLAMDINLDENEQEDMGSLTLITFLFKNCLAQRDRLNALEYSFSVLQKKIDSSVLTDYINKEINKALDKKKISE